MLLNANISDYKKKTHKLHLPSLQITFFHLSLTLSISSSLPAMAVDEFSRSVDMGIRLSKRLYYGKDSASMCAPKPPSMEKSLSSSSSASSLRLPQNHHPTSPMAYAVITEPVVVDNPDIRSYQPYIYGRCDPPALIPLHMVGVTMEVDCYLDTAFVTVTGAWRIHCVTSSSFCNCRIAIPMGEQGSVLGVEVETTTTSYFTQLIIPEDEKHDEQETKKDGFLMKGNTYTFQISQVEGGSNIHVKVKWCQKMLYQGGDFCLSVPFTFPAHVFPVFKKASCKEKIVLNVNSGTRAEITCNIASHPLKEINRQAGQLGFSYEAVVAKWSSQDLYFAYSVCSNEMFGGLLLQSPSLHDYDKRDMFCFYLFPGSSQNVKPFRKEVVFVIDISGSMRDGPLEKTKDEVIGSLWKLNQGDSFNIVASNGDIRLFSCSLELVTDETITSATEWMNTNLIADGGTNLLLPLKQAIDMVGKTGDSIPFIFLITDGTVEDEREICNMMKGHIVDGELNSPRICTFGIGSYCNHYFLQMLANIGRGQYDSAYDVDSISVRMRQLLDNATTPLLLNVTLDALENLESHEIFPFRLPDLLSGSPLIVSGRFKGKFPDIVKVRGFLADLSVHVIDVKVRKANDMPLEMVCSRREIGMLTAQAWLDQDTQLEEKVAKMSLQRGVPSEYTCMILVQHDNIKPTIEEEKYRKSKNEKITYLINVNVGFGNLIATAENLPPGIEELQLSEPAGKVVQAASCCWAIFFDHFCCRCFIQACGQVNDQCAIALTQLCTALACFQCLSCCCETCDSCTEMCLCL